MQIKGKIVKVFCVKETWASFVIKTEDGYNVRAAGKIECHVADGSEIEIEGDFFEDPKYGKQFKFNMLTLLNVTETKQKMVLAFLKGGAIKGVGPVTAEAIINRFGDDVIDVMQNHIERLLEIKGISEKKLEKIKESYNSSNSWLPIYDHFNGYITLLQVTKIYNIYGNDAVKKITENPYCLIYDIDGFGFKTADRLALSSGIPATSKVRIRAAVTYVLMTMSQTEGHCFADPLTIQERVIDFLFPIPKLSSKKDNAKYREALEDWESSGSDFIKGRTDSEELDKYGKAYSDIVMLIAESIYEEADAGHIVIDTPERIYWKDIFDAESLSAEIIVELLTSPVQKIVSNDTIKASIEKMESIRKFSLANAQKESITVAMKNRISVITGGPGRGKTTIIMAMIHAWNDDENVILCAPTGRAAQRMSESTGLKAGTIQSLIYSLKLDNDTQKKTLFIADESSMDDVVLGSELLKLARYSTIVFVGDQDQLASIGPGCFLRDMINSPHMNTVFLKKGFRSYGSIAQNADMINDGASVKNFILDDNSHFIVSTPEDIEQNVLNIYKELMKKYPRKDIGVLSPLKKTGFGCIQNLTQILRENFNPYYPSDPVLKNCKFRMHDRVMVITNLKKKEIRLSSGLPGLGVFNGDCGEITEIDTGNDTLEVSFDDGRVAVFPRMEFETLANADAITVHKSQGSEYATVIMIMNKQHSFFLRRNLFYTGVTRAREELYIVGTKDAAAIAISRIDDTARNTYLTQRIEEYWQKRKTK